MSGVYSSTGPLSPGDAALVETLNREQGHRGPDDSGVWANERIVLGHDRLAVVDLSDTGKQPFTSADRSWTVVYNGEIYNHQELRSSVSGEVASACDGAVIPQVLAEHGVAGLRTLRGMYAGAAYNSIAGTTTLFRDPFGIKPLFYTHLTAGRIAFASEPGPLAGLHQTVGVRLEQIERFLRFGSVSGNDCVFDTVHCLPANTWHTFGPRSEDGGVIDEELFVVDDSARSDAVRSAFVDSVGMHLRSDVDTALLLSSGIDSSAIAWAAGELGVKAHCITVDLGEGRSEASTATETARRYGHRHELVSRTPDGSLVDRYFDAMQQPTIDGVNTMIVSDAIRSAGLKVAVSGLGGDEMLGGYATFARVRALPALRLLDRTRLNEIAARAIARRATASRSAKEVQLVRDRGNRSVAALVDLSREVNSPETVAALLGRPARQSDAAPAPTHENAFLDVSRREITGYMGSTLLPDADVFSMRCSVELRVPFVDRDLMRATRAPGRAGNLGKAGFAGILGDSWLGQIARVPKQGFNMPMDTWMRSGLLAGCVRKAELSDAPVRRLLDSAAIDSVFGAWRAGRASWSSAWALTALDAWLRTRPQVTFSSGA